MLEPGTVDLMHLRTELRVRTRSHHGHRLTATAHCRAHWRISPASRETDSALDQVFRNTIDLCTVAVSQSVTGVRPSLVSNTTETDAEVKVDWILRVYVPSN